MATIRTNKRKNPFVQIDKTVLNDERLSFKAKGLAAYLLSKPDNWEANYRHLATVGTDGETAVRSGLQELEDAGYLVSSRYRQDDGTFEWESVLYEQPQPGYPCVENPGLDNPSLDNPSLDNHRNNNNRSSNNGDNNNERTIKIDQGDAGKPQDTTVQESSSTEGDNQAMRSDDRDGRWLREMVRGSVFMYMDRDATRIAMQIEQDWNDEQILKALEATKAAHQKKISQGDRGITAPLAYLKAVLLGMEDDHESKRKEQEQKNYTPDEYAGVIKS